MWFKSLMIECRQAEKAFIDAHRRWNAQESFIRKPFFLGYEPVSVTLRHYWQELFCQWCCLIVSPLCYILTSSSFLQLTSLELQYVSPKLLMCRDLELAVPGTYDPNQPIIRIQSIAPSLQVITSKQRPRKLTIMGKIRRKLHRPCGSEPIRLRKQMKEYQ